MSGVLFWWRMIVKFVANTHLAEERWRQYTIHGALQTVAQWWWYCTSQWISAKIEFCDRDCEWKTSLFRKMCDSHSFPHYSWMTWYLISCRNLFDSCPLQPAFRLGYRYDYFLVASAFLSESAPRSFSRLRLKTWWLYNVNGAHCCYD